MPTGIDLRAIRSEAYGARNGTHLPLLASVLAIARPGPVLEIGVGHCSSPLIAEMCRAMGREWWALDSHPDWLRTTLDLDPKITVLGEYSEMEWQGEWSVVFVDCSPGTARLPVVQALRSRAEFIVVHDTDNLSGDVADLVEVLDAFPHHFTYKRMSPWTTVVSDVRAYL